MNITNAKKVTWPLCLVCADGSIFFMSTSADSSMHRGAKRGACRSYRMRFASTETANRSGRFDLNDSNKARVFLFSGCGYKNRWRIEPRLRIKNVSSDMAGITTYVKTAGDCAATTLVFSRPRLINTAFDTDVDINAAATYRISIVSVRYVWSRHQKRETSTSTIQARAQSHTRRNTQ